MPSWLPARAQVGAAMASCWHETKRHGRPALSTPCIAIVDPTKLKYIAVTVMTAASTVLGKSVRFLEHVSPGCCAGISRVSCLYPGPRESVHIKLLAFPVSFHTIIYVYSWFIVLTESLLTVRLAVSEIKPVQSLMDGQTDRRTDRQNCQLQ